MRQDYVVEHLSALIDDLKRLRKEVVEGKIEFMPEERITSGPQLPPREATVLRVLKRGPTTAADMRRLGFSGPNFRQVVLNLRSKGYRIVCEKGVYYA